MNETAYAMWLSEMKGMTPYKCYALFLEFKSFAAIYQLSCEKVIETIEKSCAGNRTRGIDKEAWKKHKKKIDYYIAYVNNLEKEEYMWTPLDACFPPLLKKIPDCPVVIYVKTQLNTEEVLRIWDRASIGIVGARRSSLYGQDVAKKMAKELTEAGVVVISGLAYGIDIKAHLGALEKGTTISVLGNGLRHCYPKAHYSIYKQIMEKGMLVSEEAFHKMPKPYMFPKRNRIISGLSKGVLVVEAAKKSGSLITADFALEQGKEVFAVPGRILDPKAFGVNDLIRQGAKPVFSSLDILEEMKEFDSVKPGIRTQKNVDIEKKLEEKEKMVYSCISYDPVHEESLVKMITELTDAEISFSLTMLELKGLVIKKSGCYYARSEV